MAGGGGSQAAPSARASSSPSLALCQTDSPPLADSAHQHGTPAERVDKGPRYTSSHLPSRKGSKATGGRVLLRPQPGKSRRFRGLICHRRTQSWYGDSRFAALAGACRRVIIRLMTWKSGAGALHGQRAQGPNRFANSWAIRSPSWWVGTDHRLFKGFEIEVENDPTGPLHGFVVQD